MENIENVIPASNQKNQHGNVEVKKRNVLQDISNQSKNTGPNEAKANTGGGKLKSKIWLKSSTTKSSNMIVKTEKQVVRKSSRSSRTTTATESKDISNPGKKRKLETGATRSNKKQSLLDFQATTQAKPHQRSIIKSEEIKKEKKVVTFSIATQTAAHAYRRRVTNFTPDFKGSGFDEDEYMNLVQDIDTPNINSARYCRQLMADLDRYHRKHEEKYFILPNYLENLQDDLNVDMRIMLVDWLIEVSEEYDLSSKTFHKAVNLVDRSLNMFRIPRKDFQLLGCACMLIAAKYEEVYGPTIDDFVYISDATYTRDEMLQMELQVLKALEFRITSTTCYGFLPRFIAAGCTDEEQKQLARYLADFAILFYSMTKYTPSKLAASVVYLTRLMTHEELPWTPTLHHYSTYNPWELRMCTKELYNLHRREHHIVMNDQTKAKSVSEKYTSEKYCRVSKIPNVNEELLENSFHQFNSCIEE